jgi:hypothetical protein
MILWVIGQKIIKVGWHFKKYNRYLLIKYEDMVVNPE